jgi:hypothetical protein
VSVIPDDIAVALGRTAPEGGSTEWSQWQLWISDAMLLIGAKLGDPANLDQAKLNYVVREAVVAHIRRPDDATQISVSVDDGSTSRTYRSAKGRIVILDEWWALLSPSKTSTRAFSLRPSGPDLCHADICTANNYVDSTGAVIFGGAYCSCGADIAGFPLYEDGL